MSVVPSSWGPGTCSHWPLPDFCPSLSLSLTLPASSALSPPSSLAASFPLLPSSTCYRSRNGSTVVSGVRGMERSRQRGREQSSSGEKGFAALHGRRRRKTGKRIAKEGGTQEFSPSPTFHPVCGASSPTHTTYVYACVCVCVCTLHAAYIYTFQVGVVHAYVRERTTFSPRVFSATWTVQCIHARDSCMDQRQTHACDRTCA